MNKREFWITNISRTRDVSLGDLRLTIRRGESRNLLDSKHYHYTEEQVEKSAFSGSIYAKRNIIKVRDVRPQPEVKPGKYVAKGPNRIVLDPRLPVINIEKPHYDDIDFINDMESDEKFASEAAAYVAADHASGLMIDESVPSENPPIKKHKK